jgi:hypothetical protein
LGLTVYSAQDVGCQYSAARPLVQQHEKECQHLLFAPTIRAQQKHIDGLLAHVQEMTDRNLEVLAMLKERADKAWESAAQDEAAVFDVVRGHTEIKNTLADIRKTQDFMAKGFKELQKRIDDLTNKK